MAEMNVPGIEYRDVVGFPGYKVGSDGSVWSCKWGNRGLTDTWRQLKLWPSHSGHLRVCLSVNNKCRRVSVQSLVLEAFGGPRPSGMVSMHFPDPNPNNNWLSNLKWGTQIENIAHRDQCGTTCNGERHPKAKLTESDVRSIREMAASGMDDRTIAKMFNTRGGTIHAVRTGFTWKHVGGPLTATKNPRSHRRRGLIKLNTVLAVAVNPNP